MRGLGNVESRQLVWERQYWKGADKEGDQVLDLDDVERLCKRLNDNLTPEGRRKAFNDADPLKRGYLDFAQFQSFAKVLKRRPEVEGIYAKLCATNEGRFGLVAFIKFVKEFQKVFLNNSLRLSAFFKDLQPKSIDSEIEAIFTKYAGSPSAPSSERRPIWQGMTIPISDYYISSSHDTYLVGHQLVGVSTIEGYIGAHAHSCRSVEPDVYGGDEEPMVYHGKTLASKVSLRDIHNAIAKYASVTSPWRRLSGSARRENGVVVVAAETSSFESSDTKEGITDLKKTWKKLRGKESDAPAGEPQKTKTSFYLTSLLLYAVGVKCHGIHPDVEYEHIFSLYENAINRLLKASMKDLVTHNYTHLVRIYAKGARINLTNYQPHRYWAAGCQVAAINWQTSDLGYRINQAMFQRNGHRGYVLKPEALRSPEKDLLSKRTQDFLDVTIISAQQLACLQDSRGQEIIEESVVDPYVEVYLHIPDWSHSPFLPETPVVKNNGFNLVWKEELCLPFDCVGDMKELIFVEIAMRQDGKSEDHEPLGIYCIPLGCLEQGFCHLPLWETQTKFYRNKKSHGNGCTVSTEDCD
ncbi:hypothetical protein HYPSUDRAFT_209563 [Hypholoma sublateritium FD-334 SS-4]|uniref:Phosphoinositide phospholipase C n=1 Tax=Hypholoma sublateritium (strain FD-334 SS-4) TaxID=945553 RepID=A0A0D2N2F0_HYPSF|nr:hypothetical protein HYPSUDRAFT_209563 [Hypholoma sublateritium FD-334 SS-4]